MSDAELRHELYEAAAQSPDEQAQFLSAVSGHRALALGEDFCGTGALSLAWARLSPQHRAVATDLDDEPLALLRRRIEADTVTAVRGDVTDSTTPADLIAALNFSIGYFYDRPSLLRYLRAARARLGAGGVFVCDLYGGADQFALGESDMELRGGARYIWEQRDADPLTARVTNAMHFVTAEGRHLRDAFVYDWRLWSAPELRDAMLEAGFASVDVYDRLGDARAADGSVEVLPIHGDELDENYVIYLAARA